MLCALCLASVPVTAQQSPQADRAPVLRSVRQRYQARTDADGRLTRGAALGRRVEVFDAQGRLERFEEHVPGEDVVVWVAEYADDARAPRRAAYWIGAEPRPYPERMVHAPDGRIHDVLYGDPGGKLRRELRVYLDPHGRELYQEYFEPRSQRRYSEEWWEFDDQGNELGRTWRRLDGTQELVTRHEVTVVDDAGRWLERTVHRNGVPAFFDTRQLMLGEGSVLVPPAAAGPLLRDERVLPVPIAPGVVSGLGTGENLASLSPDGQELLFSRYTEDWRQQQLHISRREGGVWREPELLDLGEPVYNATFLADGGGLIACRRDDSLPGARLLLVRRTGSGWSAPVDLSADSGVFGSYPCALPGGVIYLHRDGDLFRCRLEGNTLVDQQRLPGPVNTPEGVEFGAWVDPAETLILFARGLDGPPADNGVFLSRRHGQVWGAPERLPLPYGWGFRLSHDGEDLIYIHEDDVVRVPLGQIGLAGLLGD